MSHTTREERNKYAREWRAKNSQHLSEYKKSQYRKKNPVIRRVFKDWRRPNGTAGSIRERNLWKRFRLTLEQYQQMYDAQNGRCAICKASERRLGKDDKPLPLSVDHDHTTNKVRKLLCGDCNTAIGLMQDSILRLQSAIEYLVVG